MRYKLTVAYDGTHFHGWQKQHPPDSDPLRTVQGTLEKAVRDALRVDVSVMGASRTDAGVHARGQVASFASDRELPAYRVRRAVNARLPRDVQIRRVQVVPDDFRVITDVTSKGYRYRIAHDIARRGKRPLFDRHYTTWSSYPLESRAMHEAAQYLIGEHDFASFTRKHHGRESTIRTVFSCDVKPVSRNRLQVDVSGNGFLYNMVRIITGTLVDVGRGQLSPESIVDILDARDRETAGATLPPEGLMLMWVNYDDDDDDDHPEPGA